MIEISVDAPQILNLGYQKLLSVLGKDEFTKNLKDRLNRLTNEAILRTSHVQSIGMKHPVPIELIYQPSRLGYEETASNSEKTYRFDELIDFSDSIVIQGGPGAGKTTLIHRLYQEFAKSQKSFPILFTLRREGAIKDLAAFVKAASKVKSISGTSRDIVWMADGYDELQRSERKQVSRLLTSLEEKGLGRFILTCRSHYEVVDLKARYLYVQPFKEQEAINYVTAFCRSYGATFDPVTFTRELKVRGFSDFLSSPLMLTLACILHTSRAQALPRNTLHLVKRALIVLSYQWDESKGVAREATEPVEAEERMNCLRRIAFEFESPTGTEEIALRETRKQLRLMHYSKVSPIKLLLETAQWYGLLVPTANGYWSFSHQTIYDFLAAEYWVDTGAFSQAISISTWNTRVAYAACMLNDCTRILISALKHAEGMEILIECLLNAAAFDQKAIAETLARRLSNPKFRNEHEQDIRNSDDGLVVTQILRDDFLRHASDDFLAAMVEIGNITTYGLGMSEILNRNLRFTRKIPEDLRAATFTVRRGRQVQLSFKGTQLLKSE